ncbi:Uncharacterized protein OBRU01_19870 [Operophtera brumata]|uniref:MADF domain-containing protein n=1 Tax=Operophtera brumata TaxID=104452 RepID=A0A0L7KVZ3_OPEBR|nr:Uncharacterized protein OBRU01_19870 [Operophtera brumata]
MSANNKWSLETTIKFIQCYKIHDCLWHFSSPDYKCKDKRNAALIAIVNEMNINDIGVTEVKNKIKNLRSTYRQELKKIENSKKSGAGLNNVYVSNIKWLKEMEEVFMNDLKRKTYENQSDLQCVASSPQANCSQSTVTDANTTNNSSTGASATPSRPKKRPREIVKAIHDLKTMHDKVNAKEEEETPFDVFGKSVAMQLKKMSIENALKAQQKIQCVLTKIGITDYRERSASSNSTYSYGSVATPASYLSYDERQTADTYEVGTENSNAVYSYIIQEPELSTQNIATNDLIHSAMQAASVSSNTIQ